MLPLAVLGSGLITGVGLNAPATCAAIRCGITGFDETRFMFDGEWILGCPVPLEGNWRGREKLLRLLVPAVKECLAGVPYETLAQIPLALCLSEEDRPGRLSGLDDGLLSEVQSRLGVAFHRSSSVISKGHVGGVEALEGVRRSIEGGHPCGIVAGVDTLLVAATLDAYHERGRLLTAENSDGFIPGEAAAAILLGPGAPRQARQLFCLGTGFAQEEATVDSDEPLRADGLAGAFRAALSDAGCTFDDLDYRLADCNGEQYGFKEAALALSRTLRTRKPEFDIWHPADCVGEVGAATVPCLLAVASAAAEKGYAPGPGVLCHVGNDDGARGAVILRRRSLEDS